MSTDLIIVESPAKVKTIRKFLGSDYLVEASVGHVRDLPSSNLGVDEDNNFQPQYQIISGKQKVVSRLKSAAKKATTVYLAPDPDREGEAIAWHVAELLKKTNTNLKRIQFNEITSRAVKDALEHPRDLDERLFYSQQARRILDRLVGYKISPLLWKKVKRGLSAGRVQSVALRLIAERERERQQFDPQEYWVLKAHVQAAAPPPVVAELWKIGGKKPHVANETQALEIEKKVSEAGFHVESVEEKERKRHPKPPFITSTLQQDASNRLGFAAKRTMRIAQQLYEGLDLGDKGTTALITYMRTDSVRISNEARNAAQKWIVSTLGEAYYPEKPRYFKTKGSAQDAHEAIRPVDPTLTPGSIQSYLSREHFRLYKLIWERFMASQMAPARFWDTQLTLASANTLWRAKGERLIFDGYLRVYSADKSQEEVELPKVQAKDALTLEKIDKEQKFTQPPARFSEASLVRKLEELGIGRPSTYAQIISTLLDRNYVQLAKKQFVPTEMGFVVADLLTAHFPQLLDVGFTAEMEKKLDSVAEGDQDWTQLLREFTESFYPTLEKAEQEMQQVKTGVETGVSCPKCGKPVVIKFGRNGEFLACTAYPDCDFTSNFTRDEAGTIVIVEPEPQERQKVGTCPECGQDLVLKKARTGSRFIACTGYPKCKYTQSYSTGVKCPKQDCPGELVEKSSKRGKVFYACNQYPDCKTAYWNWPIAEECPTCGSPILVRKETKARGEHVACPEKGCGYWRELRDDEKH
ncbi:type I DNA topoisomerase [Desulfohalobium retbaense]|uniref:DNA topoisomerase 1 n=1 Tax=Desulfohalobium retbaense (strain ATCC 49708 / DSM 5692 / JCM 16813 / HR100) TaxID=485915 RepID=C8WZB0_DESRD|nr:type I DNA topoisomerase [Desulfohalobium retbaense]ACV67385.1 DNA topoisomerase I [Desulfohalobium retbaense DSM 5692]